MGVKNSILVRLRIRSNVIVDVTIPRRVFVFGQSRA